MPKRKPQTRRTVDHHTVLLHSLENASTQLRQAEIAAEKLERYRVKTHLRSMQEKLKLIYLASGGQPH